MKLLLILIYLVLSTKSFCQSTFRVAFGSCSRQDSTEQLWREVVLRKPDIWIWGGDNIYGSTLDFSKMQHEYAKQKNNPDYQQLLKICPITGTWDDHDYGINDGGMFFAKKLESKKIAAQFLGFTNDNAVWTHEGLYNSTVLKKGKAEIKIINLDTRYFRDTLYRSVVEDIITKQRTVHYTVNIRGDILGSKQWQWLDKELKNSKADLFILNSSIQVLAEEHRFEKWGNFPAAQKKLIALLERYPSKKIIIISGDRHIAELSKKEFKELPYPLYDFTSSGLTHTWATPWQENNSYRVGKLIVEKNFGEMDISIMKNKVSVVFNIRGKNGVVYETHYIHL